MEKAGDGRAEVGGGFGRARRLVGQGCVQKSVESLK